MNTTRATPEPPRPPPAVASALSPMNLEAHGGGCRCLLRLRENQGLPGMSDVAFLARFRPMYPSWEDRPGEADAARLFDIARALGLGEAGNVVCDYADVLREHRAGRSILVQTERAPAAEVDDAPREFTLLLVDMTESGFTVWCPYPSGQSETLPRADRRYWKAWRASALVIRAI